MIIKIDLQIPPNVSTVFLKTSAHPVGDRPQANTPSSPSCCLLTCFPAAQIVALRHSEGFRSAHESFRRAYQWRRGLCALTACLQRDYNTVKRQGREITKVNTFLFAAPFYFCLCVRARSWPRFHGVDRPAWQRQAGKDQPTGFIAISLVHEADSSSVFPSV